MFGQSLFIENTNIFLTVMNCSLASDKQNFRIRNFINRHRKLGNIYWEFCVFCWWYWFWPSSYIPDSNRQLIKWYWFFILICVIFSVGFLVSKNLQIWSLFIWETCSTDDERKYSDFFDYLLKYYLTFDHSFGLMNQDRFSRVCKF